MAGIWAKLTGFMNPDKTRPEQAGEVTLAVCVLEGVEAAILGKLRPGVELALIEARENVAVMLKGRPAGRLPQDEAVRIAGLLERKTRLSCQVVSTGAGDGPVRVRISILMQVAS